MKTSITVGHVIACSRPTDSAINEAAVQVNELAWADSDSKLASAIAGAQATRKSMQDRVLAAANKEIGEVSQKLATRWNLYGGVTPEWGGVHPFAGSMEVHAHFVAGDDYTGLDNTVLISAAPEPGTMAYLAGAGLLAIGALRRRSRQSK